MDISKLQGHSSFQVRKAEPGLNKIELSKSLENNGKVDMVLEDESTNELYVVSGEKIDLKELQGALGQALPRFKVEHLNDREIWGAKIHDDNKDGYLTEKELKHSVKESLGKGWDTVGRTIGGGAEVGSMYGMAYGFRGGSYVRAPNAGAAVGMGVGGFLGGVVGFVSSPFTGAAKAYQVSGTYQTDDWSHFGGAMRTLK